ncbi:hypothetical protein FBZ87_11936 [Nitrospirillum amazonense]|uniref:Uncharacterized protein n=1 Tax=Nitrospirillum amazonense TaxID=28077 RepID=A0A560J4F9_9PROT|nr:hypothetical protein FBZ87_11936 [Nitrospirillum amazonense]
MTAMAKVEQRAQMWGEACLPLVALLYLMLLGVLYGGAPM